MVKLPARQKEMKPPDTVTVRVGYESRARANELVQRWGLTTQRDVWDFLVGAAFESGLRPEEIASRLGVQAKGAE